MKKGIAISALLIVFTCAYSQVRHETLLSDGWQMSLDGGQNWKSVTVPHDWAIEGPFDKKWDLQTVAIEQNGEKVASEKTGRSGALPWIGEGVYKTQFFVPSSYGRTILVFDGAMSEPQVYVNGKYVGGWAYGYNTFRLDVTSALNDSLKPNQLEVRLKNVEESSRWYPGAGIYRPVKVISTNRTSIDEWENFFRTLSISDKEATTQFTTKLIGYEGVDGLSLDVRVNDEKGFSVANEHLDVPENGQIDAKMLIKTPHLWTPETPYLYNVVVRLFKDNELIDETTMKTGLRTIRVSADKGFELNGVSRKLKGVCLHHDLGPLGAAINKAALIRQIRLMKEMGADAIRTAHNMPSQWQMEVCDSLGMMVMAESFDMWIYPKCKNGYARFFKEWSEKDITNLILAHRNHPSIIMWSIGNEIPEQGSEEGRDISSRLQNLCHQLDPTRPVTQGMDRAEPAIKSGFAQVMDVPGFNYRVHKYPKSMESLPQGFLLGSETASTVSSRGVYKFPVEISNRKVYKDGQCSSYDTEYCSWSNLPEDDFIAQDDLPYTIGQFVWTGFDYLGEPTPYDGYWPSRSSYFGICDLAGLPKDRYYLYRSIWNENEHTIHLLPHWTWPERKGKVVPVYCYTDYSEAELFVNGKSQGRISKNREEKMDRYRLRWNNVIYEPGELKVVVYDKNGQPAGEKHILTASKPASIKLEADRSLLSADGNDISFVTVSLVDENGTLIPNADDGLQFFVEGEGRFQAACNGDATSLESFTQPHMKLFNGQLVVLVRTTEKSGDITLRVEDIRRKITSSITLHSK
ncbi:MAG: DUF4982 domain-containing protein [Prevotella sp.]|nr:DUF4982 domain-containing protein [Prevotella sp.]